MNLWLRLIWMLLTVWWRSKVSYLDTARYRLMALPSDIDINGHVTNGRYLTLADIGRMDFLLRTDAIKAALALRAFPIIGDSLAKFRRDLKPFQRFDLHTRLLGWDDKWTFLEHRFLRQGRVLGVVVVRGLFKGPAGPIPPQVFFNVLGIETASPALPAWVVEWNRSCNTLSETLRQEEQAAA